MIAQPIQEAFGERIRVRVCGICIQNEKVLLLNHKGLNAENIFWSAPGGGLEFGETVAQCLQREWEEECGVKIEIGSFLNFYEYVNEPLHAVELFFEVNIIEGDVSKGTDPETNFEVIDALQWWPLEQLKKLPKSQLHQHLWQID